MQATDRTQQPMPGQAQQIIIQPPKSKVKMEHTQPTSAPDVCNTCGLTFEQAQEECTDDLCISRALPGDETFSLEPQWYKDMFAPTPPFGEMAKCTPAFCDREGGCWCKVQDFSKAARPFNPNFNL